MGTAGVSAGAKLRHYMQAILTKETQPLRYTEGVESVAVHVQKGDPKQRRDDCIYKNAHKAQRHHAIMT